MDNKPAALQTECQLQHINCTLTSTTTIVVTIIWEPVVVFAIAEWRWWSGRRSRWPSLTRQIFLQWWTDLCPWSNNTNTIHGNNCS